ncbi:MAG: RluA family pseudouridine synthase [Planctomycetota bacterium]
MTAEGSESVETSIPTPEEIGPLILPGGKVNPDAIRKAYELAASRPPESSEESAPLWRVTFRLQRDLGTRLDKYITSRVTFMSRNQIQRLIESGSVTVNGSAARSATKLRSGDRVDVLVPPPPSTEIIPQDIPINVMFEDDHLVVLNKQPDIIVHPARAEKSGTMINALAYHFKHRTGGGLSPVGSDDARPGVVHRLDRHTTGCICFAKSEEAHWKLGRQWEERTVDKRYLAVVHGRFAPTRREADGVEVIDEPLGPHPSREKGYREKQTVRYDDLGKPSTTIARVRERYVRPGVPEFQDREFTLVELELKTGRTHQIRVHMAHRGHSLAGDDMYGGRPVPLDNDDPFDVPALHAALLAFEHPISGESLVFSAPPRERLAALIGHLRAHDPVRIEAPGAVPLARFGL